MEVDGTQEGVKKEGGKHKARRPGKKTSRWWFVLIVVLGLVAGGAAGFFVHELLKKKPAPANNTQAATTAANSSGQAASAAKGTGSYSQPQPCDVKKVNEIMTFLSSNIGSRVAGRAGEKQAAAYLRSEMEKLGYAVTVQEFALSSGEVSENLIASDPGTSGKYIFVVGAHMDTRYSTPGANDDASGCAAVLEIARTIKNTKHLPEVRLLVFGAEEESGSRDSSRLGSRHYVGSLANEDKAKIAGMVSLDMIGVGPELHLRSWGANSPPLAQAIQTFAASKGLNAIKDENQKSDHEPFGEAGLPAVWAERMLPGGETDPEMHESGDTMSHVLPNLVVEVGDMLRSYLLGLDEAACKSLTAR